MFWFFCLLLNGGHAQRHFLEQLDLDRPDMGYSAIHYKLDGRRIPIKLRIHRDLGCVLLLNRPFDDTWAADMDSSSKAAHYYHYLVWGADSATGETDRRKVIVSARYVTQKPVNLFFLFGEHVVEILLEQVNDPKHADRVVRLLLERDPPRPVTPPPIPKREKAEVPKTWLSLPFREDARKLRLKHGLAIYNFENPPYFLYFKPKTTTPNLTVCEVIRGVRKNFLRFEIEYPISPKDVSEIGNAKLFVYDRFALNPKGKLMTPSRRRTHSNGQTLKGRVGHDSICYFSGHYEAYPNGKHTSALC